jgi:hypothetical protein
MAKKRYSGYKVYLDKRVTTKREAEALAEELKQQYGGWTKVVPQALDKCPGQKDPPHYTQDHAHARYDGDKWCRYCEAEL